MYHVPERPTEASQEVLDAAAFRMMEAVNESRGGLGYTDDQLSQIRTSLEISQDGFARCVYLMSVGWAPNENTVDVLRQSSRHENIALKDAEIAWVMRHGVRFPASEGVRVTFGHGGMTLMGVVSAVRSSLGRAIVNVPPTNTGSGTYDVRAEDVSRVWNEKQTESTVPKLTRIENVVVDDAG